MRVCVARGVAGWLLLRLSCSELAAGLHRREIAVSKRPLVDGKPRKDNAAKRARSRVSLSLTDGEAVAVAAVFSLLLRGDRPSVLSRDLRSAAAVVERARQRVTGSR